MIYLDSSVVLAHVLSQRPVPTEFWENPLTSSRLLQYEVWNRLHAYGASTYRHQKARNVLRSVGYVEMTPSVLLRALSAFEPGVKTLDGLHLATMHHLRERGMTITLASYDRQFLYAAEASDFLTLQP